MGKRHPSVYPKADPLPRPSPSPGHQLLQAERRPWNRPDEIRNQSGIHLSLMLARPPPAASPPPGRSPAPVRRLSPLPVGNSLPAVRQHAHRAMHCLVTGRRVQNGLIRSRIPFPTDLTRRAAHSGLLESICGDYQRGLITFKSRPFSSKNPHLWSFVRTRHRYHRRSFRLDPARKVLSCHSSFFLLSLPYVFCIGKYPNPSPFSLSRIHMAPHNWSSTVTSPTSKNSPPCQLLHQNLSS